MKKRYRLIRRESRGGKFYLVDTLTNKRESLKTANEDDAEQMLNARNQAERQPVINKHIAKAYLAASDSSITKRTWQDAFDAIIDTKREKRKRDGKGPQRKRRSISFATALSLKRKSIIFSRCLKQAP